MPARCTGATTIVCQCHQKSIKIKIPALFLPARVQCLNTGGTTDCAHDADSGIPGGVLFMGIQLWVIPNMDLYECQFRILWFLETSSCVY